MMLLLPCFAVGMVLFWWAIIFFLQHLRLGQNFAVSGLQVLYLSTFYHLLFRDLIYVAQYWSWPACFIYLCRKGSPTPESSCKQNKGDCYQMWNTNHDRNFCRLCCCRFINLPDQFVSSSHQLLEGHPVLDNVTVVPYFLHFLMIVLTVHMILKFDIFL